MRIIQALMQSLESGRWVRMDESLQRAGRGGLRWRREIRRPGIQPPPMVNAASPSG